MLPGSGAGQELRAGQWVGKGPARVNEMNFRWVRAAAQAEGISLSAESLGTQEKAAQDPAGP